MVSPQAYGNIWLCIVTAFSVPDQDVRRPSGLSSLHTLADAALQCLASQHIRACTGHAVQAHTAGSVAKSSVVRGTMQHHFSVERWPQSSHPAATIDWMSPACGFDASMHTVLCVSKPCPSALLVSWCTLGVPLTAAPAQLDCAPGMLG